MPKKKSQGKDPKCFALSSNKLKCRALEQMYCCGYMNCPFYKPMWKQEEEIEESYERFRRMTEAEQRSIANKYYDGEMPWRDEY